MKIRAALAAFALAVAGLLVTAGPAQAAPVDGRTFAGTALDTPRETGCPTSFELFVVADLQATQLGYTVPTDIDAAGNNNGLICGKPLSPNAQKQFCNKFVDGCPVDIVYFWLDDNLGAG